jgi:carboxypeptidase family protein
MGLRVTGVCAVFLCAGLAAQNAVPSSAQDAPAPSKPESPSQTIQPAGEGARAKQIPQYTISRGTQSPSEMYRISGVVVSAVDNQPLGDVDVTIAATERRDDTRDYVTGGDGRFVFQNVPRGKYSLTGMRRGVSAQAYQQHDEYSTAIAIGPGLASEDLVFQLTPDASISGSVLDEENEPVRSGEVILVSHTGESGGMRMVQRSSVDEQGRFRFSHLKAGTYYLAVTAQPWYAQDPPVSAGDREPLGHVQASGSTAETASGENADTPVNASAGASNATARGVDPSSLDVVYPVTYYPNATDAESAEPIQLHPGEHASADITVHAVPAIHLRIVNGSTNRSMPVTTVIEQRIFDQPMPVSSRNQVTSNGTITVTGVPPGHLLLSVRRFTGKAWVSLNKEINASSDTDIDASENSTGPVVIKGTVHRPGGVALSAGTYVRFFSRETGETFGSQVNEQGEFELEQAITGSTGYSVAVFNARGQLVNSVAGTGVHVAGHTVYFPRTGSVQLNIGLSEGSGRIDGTVLQEGKPAPQTMVLLVPPRPTEEPTLFRRDQSDSDGTFTLREILPGRYTVVAIERGWELDWQDPTILKPYLEHGQVLDIAANKTYKISLNLQPREAASNSARSTARPNDEQ